MIYHQSIAVIDSIKQNNGIHLNIYNIQPLYCKRIIGITKARKLNFAIAAFYPCTVTELLVYVSLGTVSYTAWPATVYREDAVVNSEIGIEGEPNA